MRKALASLAFLIVIAQPGSAQEPVSVGTGSTVRIQLRDATILQARILAIGDDSLAVQRVMNGPATAVARTDINSLQVRMTNPNRGRYALRAGLMGAVLGGASLLALGIALDDNCRDCASVAIDQKILGGALFVAVPAVTGALAGWLFAPGVWKDASLR